MVDLRLKDPKNSTVYETNMFRNRRQKKGERLQEFVHHCEVLAKGCQFNVGNTEKHIYIYIKSLKIILVRRLSSRTENNIPYRLGVSIDVTISLDGISGFLGKCKMSIIKKQEVANQRDGAFGL